MINTTIVNILKKPTLIIRFFFNYESKINIQHHVNTPIECIRSVRNDTLLRFSGEYIMAYKSRKCQNVFIFIISIHYIVDGYSSFSSQLLEIQKRTHNLY